MQTMSELLKNYVETTTKQLVDDADEVVISVVISTKTVIIQIKTAKQDCGKVIGKKGRTVEAIKILVLAIKNTHFPEDSRRVSVEIIEDETSHFSYKDKEE
jgi:predicted RNA-binding protein YlqC (UPF0109 family)